MRVPLALVLLLCIRGAIADSAPASPYFAIEVVDAQTGRGVPMVELQTTSAVSYYTDSNGLIAFNEPGLMDKRVWFSISSHGYEFPADGFGNRGVALEPRAGGKTQLKIKRLNIAERLYRITGQAIYRDTVLLGRTPRNSQPILNAEVTGQDSVLNAVYRGKLYWFYGDTLRLSYALGNYSMTGAITDLPDKLNPSTGFVLKYFTSTNGFVRPMAPIGGEGVVWLSGIVVLPDESGKERMLAYYQRRLGMGPILENGFVIYNDSNETFERLKTVPINPPLYPQLRSFRLTRDGSEYVYFNAPYPELRVKAGWSSYLDLSSYESYTCLKPGTHSLNKEKPQLDRGADGALIWSWKKDTAALNPKDQRDLVVAGLMKNEESPFRLQDVGSGKPVLLNNCSCFWNAYRKRYIMIASEVWGASMLGEVWFSQSEQPEGPWVSARKIITHAGKKNDAHDFYNPTQHPFFDHDGGRIIYLEGSYVNTFSGNPHVTPFYEYNQIMYLLDLSDPRLN